ncbi:MAG: UspA domain protein [Acidimicrobiia bacterium]|nr:UspA domain protein [Acidimicrobiia bacterium]
MVGAGLASEAAAAADALLVHDLRDHVDQMAALRGVRAEFVDREGDPATVLICLANEVQADVIVVGASTRLGHRVFGSVAVRLVRHAPCPVTVVP